MTKRWVLGAPPQPPHDGDGPVERQRWNAFFPKLVDVIRRLFFDVREAETRIDALESASSGGNSGTFEIDFGLGAFCATATVAAAWVAADSEIVFAPNHTATADHSVEETLVEGVTVAVTALTAGVSFSVMAVAPSGTTGLHRFSYVGV